MDALMLGVHIVLHVPVRSRIEAYQTFVSTHHTPIISHNSGLHETDCHSCTILRFNSNATHSNQTAAIIQISGAGGANSS